MHRYMVLTSNGTETSSVITTANSRDRADDAVTRTLDTRWFVTAVVPYKEV